MHVHLLDFLVCPDCLPRQEHFRLKTGAVREDDDILSGQLECPRCSHTHSIHQGMAVVLPQDAQTTAAQLRYETSAAVGSYLWSHYSDIVGEEMACDAYGAWASKLGGVAGPALDVGCAMGRITFELAAEAGFAVGVDFSRSFTRMARELRKTGRLESSIVVEGKITRPFTVELPERLRTGVAEFIVGDAMALPFSSDAFPAVSSLNLLDKVCRPEDHVRELCRVAAGEGCRVLVADPFSWAEEICPPGDWLGGVEEGDFAGRGLDNLKRLLEEEEFEFSDTSPVWWTIRNHENHFERIRSWTVAAQR
ncbi:SAM-dependent methyltransferase [Oceanidesulfovibrio indonesiensis]|uniref:SAM-dependent methyltransferase n=1 Tax=Oceanidesulfovibrio indonesiensis TaxID=54767 RepID=A0A7M3MBX7_9BACT|nr:methyltransferase domain-containing protein [Oceanidesulfovibrio indonesiensis]TVM15813.1 SAM-dependent methyltransferase [Oceanidesulfovibrio indonesiensis]